MVVCLTSGAKRIPLPFLVLGPIFKAEGKEMGKFVCP